MEQRFKEQTCTVSKQYSPKIEMVVSGVLTATSFVLLLVFSLV